jgi:hypothetical protein
MQFPKRRKKKVCSALRREGEEEQKEEEEKRGEKKKKKKKHSKSNEFLPGRRLIDHRRQPLALVCTVVHVHPPLLPARIAFTHSLSSIFYYFYQYIS